MYNGTMIKNKSRFSIFILVVLLIIMLLIYNVISGTSKQKSSEISQQKIEEPAIKATSLTLDAKRLIFAQIDDTLTLEPTISPQDTTEEIKFTSSNPEVAAVNQSGLVKAKNWGECIITAEIGEIQQNCHVAVAQHWAALTFDDGPGLYTDELLKGLKEQNVQATFFVLGVQAKSFKDVIQNIHDNGHEIASHTYSHKNAGATLMDQLSKTDKVIEKVIGKGTTLMRPPGGGINDVTKKCGKAIIMWDVDPLDWKNRDASIVRKRVNENTESGSIILLHDIHKTSVEAALVLTKDLKEKGYTFVTVSDLIGTPEANKIYQTGRSEVQTMKLN